MKKAILKLYIVKKISPLFIAEIYDDVEETIKKLITQLNDKDLNVITFGNITFKKELFKLFEIKYK